MSPWHASRTDRTRTGPRFLILEECLMSLDRKYDPVAKAPLTGASFHPRGHEDIPLRPESDLPSVKDILAGAPTPRQHSRLYGSARPDEIEPTPTASRGPNVWSVPLGIFWLPVTLLVLGMGVTGSSRRFIRARDCSNAAIISQRLLNGASGSGKDKPLPESVVASRPSWWHTSTLHLVEWGLFLGRTATTSEQRDSARDLLDAAVQLSPINPVARLTRAQSALKSNKATDLVTNLGLSRDVASLTFSAGHFV